MGGGINLLAKGKKTNQKWFLSEFQNLDSKIKRKFYVMFKNSEILLKLEGFFICHISIFEHDIL